MMIFALQQSSTLLVPIWIALRNRLRQRVQAVRLKRYR
jgi:hypothetical protein